MRCGRSTFKWDQTADGHNVKLLHVVDEFTREALVIECHRRVDADKTEDVLDRLVGERGTAPTFCNPTTGRRSPPTRSGTGVASAGSGGAYIEPGSPWQNA
jgi:hypothetical protein